MDEVMGKRSKRMPGQGPKREKPVDWGINHPLELPPNDPLRETYQVDRNRSRLSELMGAEYLGTRDDVPPADERPLIVHAAKHINIDAVAVPEIRQQMIDDVQGFIKQLHGLGTMVPQLDWLRDHPDYSVKSLQWLEDNLEESTLYWVSPEMCDLLQVVVDTLPPTVLTGDMVPELSGLIVFAKTMTGRDARPDLTESICLFDAMQWGSSVYDIESNIRKDGGEAYRLKGTGVSIACWTRTNHWMPLGRSDWPFGFTTMTTFAPDDYTDAQVASINEDRRFLAAFWLLTQQDGVTDMVEQHPGRHVVKRLTRRKSTKPEARVRLVNVHTPRHAPPEGGHRDVEWTRRWLVRGHWRQVPCGPGKTERRPVYVMPFVKGPEDKPLIINEVVRVWKD